VSVPESEESLRSVSRPKQARSERTLHRILEAAEELIEEKGIADVSIPDIVARARSSVGGFYGRFKDKNELLRALEERFFNRLSDRVEQLARPERWRGFRIPDIAAALVRELVQTARAHQNLIAAFLMRATADPEFRDEGLRFRRNVSRRVSDLLLGRPHEIRHPEPAVAVDLAVQLAFGLMFQHVSFGGTWAGGRTLSEADLERELTRTFLSYLGVGLAS